MPTASGEPPFTDTDGNCSFPNASPYWVATSGDPDGYSPGSGITLNGTAVRRRPAAYSIGNPGAQIYGLQFEADFDGSASARSSSAEFDTAIMAIFYTDSECFLGGKEFGFWKEYGFSTRVIFYYSDNSNCGIDDSSRGPSTGSPTQNSSGVTVNVNSMSRCRLTNSLSGTVINEFSAGWDLSLYVISGQTFNPSVMNTYRAEPYYDGTNWRWSVAVWNNLGVQVVELDEPINSNFDASNFSGGRIIAGITKSGQPSANSPEPQTTVQAVKVLK